MLCLLVALVHTNGKLLQTSLNARVRAPEWEGSTTFGTFVRASVACTSRVWAR